MKPFKFHLPKTSEEALEIANTQSAYLAGGTNQIDLMKKHIAEPSHLIKLSAFTEDTITTNRKGITLSASSSNSAVADHPHVIQNYPLLSKAILAGASPQIRNMATTGGNLLQRTRCPYFYDTTHACNKRNPNSGCSALNGHQRMAAIVGYSAQCVAVHPSDFCVALSALDAKVKITKQDGDSETIAIENFHRLPGNTPQIDTNLPENALINAVFVPKNNFGQHVSYVKIRERDSYAFALVSAAVALEFRGRTIKSARLASGGVAHKPWRWHKAEAFLKNKSATQENFERAASIALSETQPLKNNSFKKALLNGALITALIEAANPKSQSK